MQPERLLPAAMKGKRGPAAAEGYPESPLAVIQASHISLHCAEAGVQPERSLAGRGPRSRAASEAPVDGIVGFM